MLAFFGLAAVAGTADAEHGRADAGSGSIAVGPGRAAVLCVADGQQPAGHRVGRDGGEADAAVRIGGLPRARLTYLLFLLVPFAVALAVTPARPPGRADAGRRCR